jgi:hypothetical protein
MTTKETVAKLIEELNDLKARVVEIERTLFNALWDKQKETTLKHINKEEKK